MAEPNKHDGVFTENTNKGAAPAPASIPPTKPRPEMTRKTRFVRGQPTGNL